MSDRAKIYHDLFHFEKARYKKYSETTVGYIRWANMIIFGALVGAEMFTSTFADFFYYWSCWGTMLTFISLVGVVKCSGATRSQIYEGWVVPTAILFEYCCAMNIAITIEFWVVFGPLMITLIKDQKPIELIWFGYMAILHVLPLVTCILNAVLSDVKFRVEDWKLHMGIGCSYLIANVCGSLALGEPVYPDTPLDWTHPVLTVFCLLL